ncbi:hypothetical protein [Mycolicibacterium sp. CBMA 226]|uniref:hypothetical protein n=1 Tax=Mycolicibacterium sp. CBMA 226 TaxID=2606611 RepID=UPI0012DE2F97|nr:hypothetical protein [Mycolicibacterium sp. CBMA 226]MUL76454.1 hypothetical protein [Mycolicibacterium sp. CBMA 226]
MPTSTSGPMPKWVLIFPITYLIALTVSAIFWTPVSSFLSNTQVDHVQLIPLVAVWMGMLGGVTISLQGIFLHNRHWLNDYTYWHAFSGVVGAIYGIVSHLFLIAILQTPADNAVLFALAAFTLGYGQRQFHSLMSGIFDLIFRPHQPPEQQGGQAHDPGNGRSAPDPNRDVDRGHRI